MDKPSAPQTRERFSTEMPFSPSSTARRKLWEIPQRLDSRLVVQPLAYRRCLMRMPTSIVIPPCMLLL